MIPYSNNNKDHKYLLTVIDVFSKYAWSVPIKNKSATSVTNAFKSILNQGRKPTNLQSDRGLEFYNNHFKNLMKEYNINHYSTYSNLKASVCERFNRTLKEKMWKQFTINGNYKWLDILQELVNNYNNTKHRTINMTPIEASKKINEEKLKPLFQEEIPNYKPKYNVGDKVRISKYKTIFEKSYTPNWSNEIFTVSKIVYSNPITYHLKDCRNEEIKGCFYEEELSSVRHEDEVYLIEKVIKRKNNQAYVKWLGFDSSHNSWINIKDIC